MQDRPQQGGGEGEACTSPAAAAAAVRGRHHSAAAAGWLCVRHHTRTSVLGTGAAAPPRWPPRPPASRCLQHQRDPWHTSAATAASRPQR